MNEWELIRRISGELPPQGGDVVKGIGDDCAVVRWGEEYLFLTKDLMTEGSHFLRPGYPAESLGRKLVNANVSDIVAMGGRPLWALLGLSLPVMEGGETEALIRGITGELRRFGVYLLGGDTVRGEELTLSLTLLGHGGRPLYRSGARPGDQIWVSAPLGYARAGLNLFLKEGRVDHPKAGEKYFQPSCRADLIPFLEENEIHGLIDISDGFVQDLGHLLEASGVGASLDLSCWPKDPWIETQAQAEGIPWESFCLNSGEEFELIATAPAVSRKALLEASWIPVGTIEPGRGMTWKGESSGPVNLSWTHGF